MLLRQIVNYKSLIKTELNARKINAMAVSLAIFPTPFKGVYYIPTPEERRATIVDKPRLVLTRAIAIYLGTKKFYYSCRTAEEFMGIKWQPSGEIHVVNTRISRVVNLDSRAEKSSNKQNYRAKRIAKILSLYGRKIIFHKVKNVEAAKFKQTPYGNYALRSQIKKDIKRFHRITRSRSLALENK